MKRRPYEVIRAATAAENSLLLPEDLGLIYTDQSEYVLGLKTGPFVRTEDDLLYSACRVALIEVQLAQLSRLGMKVRRAVRFVRSKRHRLGVRELYLTPHGEPVMFSFGNGEASAVYSKAYAQTLMLVTGAPRCLESSLSGGGSGSVSHSGAVRVADKVAQRAILEVTQSFWKHANVPASLRSRETLLAASAQSRKTCRLGTRALDVVASLANAKQERRDAESQISSLETNLLRRLRGAHRGLLEDGSQIVVTAVHRDAHYVGPADYQQIRHVTGQD